MRSRYLSYNDQIKCFHKKASILPRNNSTPLIKDGLANLILVEELVLQPVLRGCKICNDAAAVVQSVSVPGPSLVALAGHNVIPEDAVIMTSQGPAYVEWAGEHLLVRETAAGQPEPAKAVEGAACSSPISDTEHLEILLVAFIGDRFHEWMPEPFTKMLELMCEFHDPEEIHGFTPEPDHRECYWTEFHADARAFGTFVRTERNARLYLRLDIPFAKIPGLQKTDFIAEALCGESHNRQHFTTDFRTLKERTQENKKTAVADLTCEVAGNQVSAHASAGYPLFFPSLEIDMDADVTFAQEGADLRVTVDFFHDRFPDYELYVQGYSYPVYDAAAAGQTGPGLNLATPFGRAFMLHQTHEFLFTAGCLRSHRVVPAPVKNLLDYLDRMIGAAKTVAEWVEADTELYLAYLRGMQACRTEITSLVRTGVWSAEEGAQAAHRIGSLLQDMRQVATSALGQAWSKFLSHSGVLEERLAALAQRRYGAAFTELTALQQREVFALLMMGMGQSRAILQNLLKGLSYAARKIVLASWCFTFWKISRSRQPGRALGREAVSEAAAQGGTAGVLLVFEGATAGAAAGSMAAAVAGSVFIPLAALTAGVLAAMLGEEIYDRLWPETPEPRARP